MMKNSFVTLLAVFIALVLTLAAGTTGAAERSDVLIVGMATSDIISLDPAKAFEFSGVGIEAQVYDRLLDFPKDRFDTPEFSLGICGICGICVKP